MKLTYEQKLKAYQEWKQGLKSPYTLAMELQMNLSFVRFFLILADRHGTKILKHDKNIYYSPEEKLRIINRVLINNESAYSVAVDEGLSNMGLLPSWIKSYKENGYNVIEKRRGRKKLNGNENQGTSPQRKQGASKEELRAYYTNRIHKKIECLSSGTRKARKEEIARAVSELRQELGCSLKFILDTIKANPSLPQINKSDYYYWVSNHTDSDLKNDKLMNEIIRIYYHHKGRYGYRRITLDLNNNGFKVNHKAVKRLMTRMGLKGVTPRSKYKSYKGDFNGTVKSKLLVKKIDEENHKTYYERDFSTTKPNEKWTTDLSEFHIAAGKLYLSPILDMFNGEIVSYVISSSPNYAQVQKMLDIAFELHKDLKGLIFHSDQGWQYQMAPYHKSLKDKGIIQSMSRKGNCLDNCVMENFFGKMKNEMFYGHEYEFTSLAQLESAMVEYINYYNTERIQVKLKGLTPCQARYQALQLT